MNKAEEFINELQERVNFLEHILSSGATINELNDLQKFIGEELPANLINLLKLANGESSNKLGILGLFFSPIDRIRQDVEYFRNAPSCFPESIYQDDLVKPNLYNNLRVPFATDESGQFLCIDYDPDTNGKIGQIIYLPCAESEPISVIADNFDEFLYFIIKSLKDQSLYLYDSREDWDEDDWKEWREDDNSDYARVEVFFERKWRDDWTDVADIYNKNQ